jgi:hypothetical protein
MKIAEVSCGDPSSGLTVEEAGALSHPSSAELSSFAEENPILTCVPSQKGLVAEAPHRHRTTVTEGLVRIGPCRFENLVMSFT